MPLFRREGWQADESEAHKEVTEADHERVNEQKKDRNRLRKSQCSLTQWVQGEDRRSWRMCVCEGGTGCYALQMGREERQVRNSKKQKEGREKKTEGFPNDT